METIDDDCDNMDIVFVCVKVGSLLYKSTKILLNIIRTKPWLPSTILMSSRHWSFSRIRSPVFMTENWRSRGKFSHGSTICLPGLISSRSGLTFWEIVIKSIFFLPCVSLLYLIVDFFRLPTTYLTSSLLPNPTWLWFSLKRITNPLRRLCWCWRR